MKSSNAQGQKTILTPSKGEVIIYQTADGQTSIEVKMENDTVWLTQAQMAMLFEKDRTVIVRHINNVYKEGELEKKATCAFFAQVQTEGTRTVQRTIPLYNLDMIISVGYRVNSKRGTQFRIWANRVLKEYLLKGYVINNKLALQKYEELSRLVQLLGRTVENKEALSLSEAQGMINVVTNYSYALDTLDNYDYEQLRIENTTSEAQFCATYEGAMQMIQMLKERFGESRWFGNEKDDSFKSSIGQIYQTFDGQELYPSVEEKAAMLLYLVTKNHSFSDGNNVRSSVCVGRGLNLIEPLNLFCFIKYDIN